MTVSADMAPGFQVVAYAILPSQAVVAHSADFNTDKCFRHSVSVCVCERTVRQHPEGPRSQRAVFPPGVSGVFRKLGCAGGAGLRAAGGPAEGALWHERC